MKTKYTKPFPTCQEIRELLSETLNPSIKRIFSFLHSSSQVFLPICTNTHRQLNASVYKIFPLDFPSQAWYYAVKRFRTKADYWMTQIKTDLYLGDCLEVLSNFDTDSFDLIMTSPPYADRRSKTYGEIRPDEYVNWFLTRAEEFLRVLKPSGTFVLNIKEQAIDGERHTYVIELIVEMRKQGWLWTEEFVWHKKNCYPGKWPNRFRDAWERCLQFNKSKKFNMYQEAVMVPMGDWAEKRLKKLSETDQSRDTSKVGSGFGKNVSNWVDRKMAYPTNVLHLATETGNRKHSAVFPKALPEWFIKLFTKENDWVLDPFAGSGTTCQVAQKLLRNSIGIEILPEYYQLAQENIKSTQYQLFEEDQNAIHYTTGDH